MIKTTNNSPSLFSNLTDMLNQSHPLYQLADKIDWGEIRNSFSTFVLSGQRSSLQANPFDVWFAHPEAPP